MPVHARPDPAVPRKISGPLLDRINIHVEVAAFPFKELGGETVAEPSAEISARVLQFANADARHPQGLRAR